MKLIIVFIILLFNLVNFLYSEDNIFNNYLLYKENFKLQYLTDSLSILNRNLVTSNINLKIQKNKRNPLKDDNKIEKFFDVESKIISPDFNIKLNNSTKITIGYKNENAEFTPVGKNKEIMYRKVYNLDLQQLWGHNIASKFSYLYQKDYFQKIGNFNFSEKKYSFNITKFFNKGDRFNIFYQYTEADLDNQNESIYMLQDERYQKISFSYEISFSNKFSLVLLYSLNENIKKEETDKYNYLYTGFKYIFDSKHLK